MNSKEMTEIAEL